MGSSEQLRIAYETISYVNQKVYEDIFMLSNQVLSKNPFTNSFLSNLVFHKEVQEHAISAIILKLLKYYFRSMVHFAAYVTNILIFLVGESKRLPENIDNLTIINIFFLTDRIRQSKRFADIYLPGLEDLLKKMNKQYIYVPVFDRYKVTINYARIKNILKEEQIPVLYEYQLLSLVDLFYLLYFIVVYPFHVMKHAEVLAEQEYELNLVKHELLDTLDQVTFYNYSRYLQGKRISRLPYKKVRVISWFENQPGDKNFYKGLRTNPDKVVIYGAQLFLYAKTDLNISVDDKEERFGIIPDKIIVNGPLFGSEKRQLNYVVGPSLRYKRIFDTRITNRMQKDLLVLLPYAGKEEENIFKVINDIDFGNDDVIIKPHPTNNQVRFRQYIRSNYRIICGDLYDLFQNAKIVIGAASGSLLEAASVGIPVVVIKTLGCLDYDILPDYGKGLIWDEATDAESLRRIIQTMEQRLDREIDAINMIAKDYREMFFLEPNEANIVRAFDLN